jgi:hypothetical protein
VDAAYVIISVKVVDLDLSHLKELGISLAPNGSSAFEIVPDVNGVPSLSRSLSLDLSLISRPSLTHVCCACEHNRLRPTRTWRRDWLRPTRTRRHEGLRRRPSALPHECCRPDLWDRPSIIGFR